MEEHRTKRDREVLGRGKLLLVGVRPQKKSMIYDHEGKNIGEVFVDC